MNTKRKLFIAFLAITASASCCFAFSACGDTTNIDETNTEITTGNNSQNNSSNSQNSGSTSNSDSQNGSSSNGSENNSNSDSSSSNNGNNGGENTHTHSYTDSVVAPTCTESGYTLHTCSCGDSYKDNQTAPAHNPVTDEAVAATCTTTGLSEGSHCSICHTVIVAQTKTPKSSHTFEDNVCKVCNQPQPTEGLAYTLSDDGTYYIASGIGTAEDTEIIIADTYNNLPVTKIGRSAFGGCKNLTNVNIPESVKLIDTGAFSSCTSLESINIPNSVTYIDDEVFYNCTNLKNINIPDTIIFIGQDVFYNTAYYNKESNWVDKVLYIGNHLIKAQSDITSCEVREGTKAIASYALNGCTNLTSVTIPEGVISIGDEAFSCSWNLTSINIPDSVVFIGSRILYKTLYYDRYTNWENKTYLYVNNHLISSVPNDTTYDIKEGIKTIASYALSGCNTLTSITIPNSVVSICEYSFQYCTSLTSITIPVGVTYIGWGAFYNSTALRNVIIYDNVATINSYAFYNCNLTNVYYTGSAEDWDKIDIESNGNERLTNATRYYYSETKPTESGNYWHYVDGEVVVWGE